MKANTKEIIALGLLVFCVTINLILSILRPTQAIGIPISIFTILGTTVALYLSWHKK